MNLNEFWSGVVIAVIITGIAAMFANAIRRMIQGDKDAIYEDEWCDDCKQQAESLGVETDCETCRKQNPSHDPPEGSR